MRSKVSLVFFSLLTLTFAPSCSLQLDFDDFEVQSEEARFLQEAQAALCARLLRCEPKLFSALFVEPVCHPTEGMSVLLSVTGYVPGAIDFDTGLAAECLEELQNADCSVQNGLVGDSCEAVLAGSLTPGEVCLSDTQCADGFCKSAPDACGGLCVGQGTTDAPCTRDGNCAKGYWCGAASTCEPLGTAGEPCARSSHCENLYWCPPVFNTCETLPDIGDPCLYQITGDVCRGSLVCNQLAPSDWQCGTGGGEGDACNVTQAPCRPGFRCSGASTCVPLVGEGGPCDSVENCPISFQCVADLCQPLPSLGDACDPTLDCVQGACVDGECALLGAGAPCSGVNEQFHGLLRECSGYCEGGGMTGLCADAHAEGAACTQDHECVDGAECVDSGSGSSCLVCD